MPAHASPASASARTIADLPVHPSLVRPTLTLGVERHVAALEATLGLALVVGIGPGLLTLAIVGALVLVLHPTMVWLTGRDPQATDVYLRNRGYAEYYAPGAAAHAPPRRPRPSLPRVR